MAGVVLNIVLTSLILTTVLWISRTNTTLGGFLVSFPLSTMIVLGLTKLQTGDDVSSFNLAKSIAVGIPSSLVFFIPFLVADKLKLPFWPAYFLGISLLVVSFFVHRWIMGHWTA